MSMFVCDTCGVIENTALAGFRGYHGRNVVLTDEERRDHPDWELGDGKARCSECNPEVGRWHGHWKKEHFDGHDPDHRRRVINR